MARKRARKKTRRVKRKHPWTLEYAFFTILVIILIIAGAWLWAGSRLLNEPPGAEILYPTKTVFLQGQTITFSAAAHDPEGGSLTYFWDFGDGTTSNQKTVAHTYNVPGIFAVSLTVRDEAGLNTSQSMIITVNPVIGSPPIVNILSPSRYVLYAVDSNISFNASVSDPDGDALTYSWESSISGALSAENTFSKKLPAGTHEIKLTVSDGTFTIEDSVLITVRQT